MTAGSDLKEGRYDNTFISAADIKNVLNTFFESISNKESTYKYAMFKSILDSLGYVEGKGTIIPFEVLFSRFAELYWVLVFEYNIPQKPTSKKGTVTLAESIIYEITEKNSIKKNTLFKDLPDNVQKELITSMKKKCSRYVFGSLFMEMKKMFYSFSIK